MTDQKTIISGITGAAIAAIVGLTVATFAGVFQRGSDALTEDQIKAVLKETLVTTINGETKTYGEALSLINGQVIVVQTRMDGMELALQALSTD